MTVPVGEKANELTSFLLEQVPLRIVFESARHEKDRLFKSILESMIASVLRITLSLLERRGSYYGLANWLTDSLELSNGTNINFSPTTTNIHLVKIIYIYNNAILEMIPIYLS
jgi:hypothetical protein